MNRQAYQRDKRRLRLKFSGAAKSYDRAAELQRLVATRLLEQLDAILLTPGLALDLGSGTGFVAHAIATRYRRCRVIQTDLAHAMLSRARSGERRLFSRQRHVCADAEFLPFADGCLDLVVSNLMLQWIDDPGRVFAECRRVLRPGGLLLFSSFGPDTLRELRASWAGVDDHVHVNAFLDMHDLGDAVASGGFQDPVLMTDSMTLLYRDVPALMRELKSLGAGNSNAGQRKSLTGKGRLAQMIDAYQGRYRAGQLPATFEVVYGHAWVAAAASGKDTVAGTVTIPLSRIGRREQGGR